MDFFEHQAVARRNTGRLIVLFLVAVGAIVLMVYGVVLFVLVFRFDPRYQTLWQPRLFAQVASAVLAVIAAGSLWKVRQLARGGAALAERVGGRRLDPASTDPRERRILNVVEEMAIAAGTPVPPVYLLDGERAINAFAAGHDASDAVIGVTRGAVEVLTRDELQGVVAHEFSHILHGDMGLNLQLIGAVYGIELIGGFGRVIVQGGRGARGKKGGAVLLGGVLMLVGGIGSLFGRMIRAAVSRQREFLADAAAVQFTRNPAGVAGALRKIGGFGFGSHLVHPRRGEMSHMFFGSGLPAWDLTDLFGTHPPLEERVRRLDPSFDGTFPTVPLELVVSWPGESAPPRRRGEEMAEAVAHFAAASLEERGRGGVKSGGVPRPNRGLRLADTANAGAARPLLRKTPKPLLERLGSPGPEHVASARALLAEIPPGLLEAARDRSGARALFLALLASGSPEVWDVQASAIGAAEGAAALDRVRAFRSELAPLQPPARLPLAEILTGTLTGLEPRAYDALRALAARLAAADGAVDLSEWILTGLVLRQLDGHFGRRPAARAHYTRLSGLETETAYVLSALAHAAGSGERSAREAFAKAAAELGMDAGHLKPAASCTPRHLEAALATLAELVPLQKRRVLSVCAKVVVVDGRVSTAEAELFRVVANWLECPAPPLLPGQALS